MADEQRVSPSKAEQGKAAVEYQPIFKSKQINEKHIRGEQGTGYEPRTVGKKDMGEFACGNCTYWKDGPGGRGCDQEEMKMHSKEPRLPDGRIKVDVGGCCTYLHRVGFKLP